MNLLKNSLFFFLPFVFLTSAVSGQVYIPAYGNVVNQCSQTNITTNLTQYEALGVKRRGTPALQNTLDWLKNKYTSYGYTTSQITEQAYTYSGSTAECKNLVVTKIGTLYPNTFVIVCGHYDSITGTGTNDNGSGVVSILEAARLLQNVPTEYSIKFINFSGEEDGLKGSQSYVSSIVNGTTPKMSIRLVFNLDEVGGVAGLVNNTITCERDTSTPTTNNALSNTYTNQLITCVGLYSPLQTYLSYAYASDYMSFQSNNEVITGFFEKNETTHKHTATDLLVNMDPVYNYNVAKAAIGATMHFAKAATSTLENDMVEQDFDVRFFPNPTKDSLHISMGTLLETSYQFSIMDVNGKVLMKKAITNASLVETIEVGQLAKGIYLGVLEAGDKRITKKIAIE